MRQASVQTASGFQRKRRLSGRVGIVAAAMAIAVTMAAVLSYAMGTTWADAAADMAYWDARGTGSLGWIDQLGAIVMVWFAIALLSSLAGMFVGTAAPMQRRAGLAVLIVAMTIVPVISFGLATGVGGELGFPEDSVVSGILASALAATLGGFIGYGLARAARRGRA